MVKVGPGLVQTGRFRDNDQCGVDSGSLSVEIAPEITIPSQTWRRPHRRRANSPGAGQNSKDPDRAGTSTLKALVRK